MPESWIRCPSRTMEPPHGLASEFDHAGCTVRIISSHVCLRPRHVVAPRLGPNSFGHSGAGGSLAFADPDAQISFAHVMNKMQQNVAGDPRTLSLIDAVKAAV